MGFIVLAFVLFVALASAVEIRPTPGVGYWGLPLSIPNSVALGSMMQVVVQNPNSTSFSANITVANLYANYPVGLQLVVTSASGLTQVAARAYSFGQSLIASQSEVLPLGLVVGNPFAVTFTWNTTSYSWFIIVLQGGYWFEFTLALPVVDCSDWDTLYLTRAPSGQEVVNAIRFYPTLAKPVGFVPAYGVYNTFQGTRIPITGFQIGQIMKITCIGKYDNEYSPYITGNIMLANAAAVDSGNQGIPLLYYFECAVDIGDKSLCRLRAQSGVFSPPNWPSWGDLGMSRLNITSGSGITIGLSIFIQVETSTTFVVWAQQADGSKTTGFLTIGNGAGYPISNIDTIILRSNYPSWLVSDIELTQENTV